MQNSSSSGFASVGQTAKTNAQKKRNFQQCVVERIESFSLSFVFFLWLFNKSSESKLTRRKEQQRFVLGVVLSFHSSSSSFSSFLNNQNDSHFAQTRVCVSLRISSSHLDDTFLRRKENLETIGLTYTHRLFNIPTCITRCAHLSRTFTYRIVVP